MLTPNLVAGLYLVSGVLFILALRGLSSPATSRQGNYFGMLGVAPVFGRTFAPDDDAIPRGKRVVVVSNRFWQDALGGAPDAIGRDLRIDGDDYTVIGVAPEGFSGLDRRNVDLWMPISALCRPGPGVGLGPGVGSMDGIGVGGMRVSVGTSV